MLASYRRADVPTARAKVYRQGFTLIEVLLVVLILAILGSMAGVYLRGAQQKGMQDIARNQIGALKRGIEFYQQRINSFPSTEQGLEALLSPPSDLPNPEKWGTTPFFEGSKIPLDPWDNPYQYSRETADTFRIWSYGPDGVDGTEDDVATDDV